MNQSVYEVKDQLSCYPKVIVLIILGFCPALALGILFSAIWLFFFSIMESGFSYFTLIVLIAQMILSVFLGFLGHSYICRGLAKYKICSKGLIVKYPVEKEKLIVWDEFQQVCICYAAYTTSGKSRANTVICFIKNAEKKNVHGRWKTDNPFKYRDVICLDYSDELRNAIGECCIHEMMDLRNTMAYKIKW